MSAANQGVPDVDSLGASPEADRIEFAARYYDGNSSRAHAVQAQVVDGTLTTLGEDGQVVRSDKLGTFAISPRLGLTVRSIRLHGGAKLESQDHEAIDLLEQQCGTGQAHRLLHRIESNWRITILSVVVMATLAMVGFHWGVPALARYTALAMPAGLAHDLGSGTLATLDRVLFKPSELTSARRAELQTQFEGLAAHYPQTPLHLVFRRAMPNAFALPDGTIVVTDELVALAEHDHEILAVIAHEIGHVHERHALRMALENSVVALVALVYIGDASEASALVASLPAVLANAHFSRTHELEADTFASELLTRAAIPHHHFADMLRRLDRELAAEKGTSTYFDSHPDTEGRAQRFLNPASH